MRKSSSSTLIRKLREMQHYLNYIIISFACIRISIKCSSRSSRLCCTLICVSNMAFFSSIIYWNFLSVYILQGVNVAAASINYLRLFLWGNNKYYTHTHTPTVRAYRHKRTPSEKIQIYWWCCCCSGASRCVQGKRNERKRDNNTILNLITLN